MSFITLTEISKITKSDLFYDKNKIKTSTYIARKGFKYKVFSGPYFPAFGLNSKRYESGKIHTNQKKFRIWTLFTQ